MIKIVNFAHPLTEAQRYQVERFLEDTITAVFDAPCQLDNEKPFLPQLAHLIDSVPLTSKQWQTEPVLINPPGLAVAASILIAELHGRMGYFPPLMRIRPVNGSIPTIFDVAEIINLQAVREQARRQR